MWMGMGPRAVTCLRDSDHWRERENRTESHNGGCFEHLRLRSSTWLITCNLVKGSRLSSRGEAEEGEMSKKSVAVAPEQREVEEYLNPPDGE